MKIFQIHFTFILFTLKTERRNFESNRIYIIFHLRFHSTQKINQLTNTLKKKKSNSEHSIRLNIDRNISLYFLYIYYELKFYPLNKE